MSSFIILTPEQAGIVRGATTSPAALNPIERAGSVYILGVGVLTDAAHAMHWDFLLGLPQMESADPGFPGELEDV